MKATLVFLSVLISSAVFAQADTKKPSADPAKKLQVLEASCGQCKFDLAGTGCDLAVRIDGKAYFVEGTAIDSHGDAHAKDGFCNAIRKAEVQGELVNDKFKVSHFVLLSEEKKTDKATKKKS